MLLKRKKPFSKMPKGWDVLTPLMFSSWNQIIQEMRNIYKLKELISIPVSTINSV